MTDYKNSVSYFLYVLCMFVILGSWLFVIIVSKEFILENKGIGVYGVLIYYAAAFSSVILWGMSYFLFKSKKLEIVFWVLFVALTTFIATQPTWWAAPPIGT